jgi:dTMP kinase
MVNLAGKFIVLDGPDGAGKGTQIKKLRNLLGGQGLSVEVVVDPGTTKIGHKIRNLLLDRDNGEISPICETFLFMASRAQLVLERIRPALEARRVVICDRFASATIAYQGASGVSPQDIVKIAEVAIGGRWPDLTLILDLPVEEGFRRLGLTRDRLKQPNKEEEGKAGVRSQRKLKAGAITPQLYLFGDRMEYRSSQYHQSVREIFRSLPSIYPKPVVVIDAFDSEEAVTRKIIQSIQDAFSDCVES